MKTMLLVLPGRARFNEEAGRIAGRYLYLYLYFCLLCLCLLFAVGARAQQQAISDGKIPTITTFDAPGAGTGAGQGTFAERINAAGVIAGDSTDSSYVSHGYVRAANGTITTFDVSGQGTWAYGINTAGVITGPSVDGSSVYHGYLWKP